MVTSFTVNGHEVHADDGASLLEVLRDRLGLDSVKDGCSPQGQCGCCTVLVDGHARVACVTPVRRLGGRSVTTMEGLDAATATRWADRFCASGAAQCGFCTSGIVMRLEGARRSATAEAAGSMAPFVDPPLADATVTRALAAHLCRCTGWQTIVEAATLSEERIGSGARSLDAASARAALEGRTPQTVAPEVSLGWPHFGDDGAPPGALVAVLAGDDPDDPACWAVAGTMAEARRAAGRVQGRNSTVGSTAPIGVPPGDWALTLQTSWVEPAYLETDAAWCAPGGEPSSMLANGGAFGGKLGSRVGEVARALADRHGGVVRVRWSREDVVRFGPKRPPLAAGLRADGTGVVRVARTPGIGDEIRRYLTAATVEEVDVVGPSTSVGIRGAGWVEAAVLAAELGGHAGDVVSPDGARATAAFAEPDRGDTVTDHRPRLHISVRCGDPLDDVVLRSYCIGAAHMAIGLVTSECLAVDGSGDPVDLTIRSFGIIRPGDMPLVRVEIVDDDGPPVCGSDAVFAAVASAVWHRVGRPGVWPTGSDRLSSRS